MTKRLIGPPPHSEDPYTKLTSPRGIPVDQLVSILQKDIRRGNVDNAVLAAYEMLPTSADVAEHLWRRLKLIAVEDVGMGEPRASLLLNCLHENFLAADSTGWSGQDQYQDGRARGPSAGYRQGKTGPVQNTPIWWRPRWNVVGPWSAFLTMPCASTPGQVRRWDADERSGGRTEPWSMTSWRRLITHIETS